VEEAGGELARFSPAALLPHLGYLADRRRAHRNDRHSVDQHGGRCLQGEAAADGELGILRRKLFHQAQLQRRAGAQHTRLEFDFRRRRQGVVDRHGLFGQALGKSRRRASREASRDQR
jgi:hypothetical protein